MKHAGTRASQSEKSSFGSILPFLSEKRNNSRRAERGNEWNPSVGVESVNRCCYTNPNHQQQHQHQHLYLHPPCIERVPPVTISEEIAPILRLLARR
jgi:hypothetical protein